MATDESIAEKNPPAQIENMEEVQKIFNSMDTDGDGLISSTELACVLKDLGAAYATADITEVMNDIDTDRDGFININEFASFCGTPDNDGDGGVSELRDAFELYDQDHNGVISDAELHLVLNRLGIACSVEDCGRKIASVDSDGDGTINFEEFQKMMSGSKQSG